MSDLGLGDLNREDLIKTFNGIPNSNLFLSFFGKSTTKQLLSVNEPMHKESYTLCLEALN